MSKEESEKNWCVERADALYDHLGSIARATVMVSSTWTLAVRQHIAPWPLGIWWLCSVLVAVGRMDLRRRYRRAKSHSQL